MITETGHFKTEDGTKLFTRTWLPETSIRSTIILVHGLGEHSGRYEHVAKKLTNEGCVVFAFDHRGHGLSEGVKGHIPSYSYVSRLLDQFSNEAKQRHSDVPVLLYGHSLGGALVLYHLLTKSSSVESAIVTSPGLVPANPPSKVTEISARILSKIYPAGTLSNMLDLSGLSKDKVVIEEYQKDPLTHDRVSFALGADIIDKGNWILNHAPSLPVPILLMQGSADRLVNPSASNQFASKNPQKITYKLWENGYHELHNEPEKEDVFKEIIGWVSYWRKS
jgi:alpha-beta hydrolase superfamily lysophospholipase